MIGLPKILLSSIPPYQHHLYNTKWLFITVQNYVFDKQLFGLFIDKPFLGLSIQYVAKSLARKVTETKNSLIVKWEVFLHSSTNWYFPRLDLICLEIDLKMGKQWYKHKQTGLILLLVFLTCCYILLSINASLGK